MEMIAMLGGLGSFTPPSMPVYGRRALGCLGCGTDTRFAGLGADATPGTITPGSAGPVEGVTINLTPPKPESMLTPLLVLGAAAAAFYWWRMESAPLHGYGVPVHVKRKRRARRSAARMH